MTSRTASCQCGQLRIEVDGSLAFAIASPASDGRGVSLPHSQVLLLRIVCLARPPSTCALAIEVPASGSGFARCAARTSSIPRKASRMEWVWPSGRSPNPLFRHPATRSTIAGATRGSGYRRARRRSSGTRCEGAMKIIPRSRRRARKHSPSEVIVRGGGRGHVARARQDVQ